MSEVAKSSNSGKTEASKDGMEQIKPENDGAKLEPEVKSQLSAEQLEKIEKSNVVYVTGLLATVHATKLRDHFNQHGKVVALKIYAYPYSSTAPCWGIIQLATCEDATRCVEKLEGSEIDGGRISIQKTIHEVGPRKRPRDIPIPTIIVKFDSVPVGKPNQASGSHGNKKRGGGQWNPGKQPLQQPPHPHFLNPSVVNPSFGIRDQPSASGPSFPPHDQGSYSRGYQVPVNVMQSHMSQQAPRNFPQQQQQNPPGQFYDMNQRFPRDQSNQQEMWRLEREKEHNEILKFELEKVKLAKQIEKERDELERYKHMRQMRELQAQQEAEKLNFEKEKMRLQKEKEMREIAQLEKEQAELRERIRKEKEGQTSSKRKYDEASFDYSYVGFNTPGSSQEMHYDQQQQQLWGQSYPPKDRKVDSASTRGSYDGQQSTRVVYENQSSKSYEDQSSNRNYGGQSTARDYYGTDSYGRSWN